MSTNELLEHRLVELRGNLDRLAEAVEDNLRSIVGELSGAEPVEHPVKPLVLRARENCFMFVVRENPKAHDLKFAMGALRVEHDYERAQELVDALHKRVSRLKNTPYATTFPALREVIQVILDVHTPIRRTWHVMADTPEAAEARETIAHANARITAGLAALRSQTVGFISGAQGTPEMTVELVLACRHIERIWQLLESLPDERNSFETRVVK